MRSRIFSSLLLATVLAPPVWAQNAEDGQQEAETPDETQGSDVVDETGRPVRPGQFTVPPGTKGRESAPGERHTVERGDTLWDLSQRYLGSPWYWPKVWSYNPEIANPHWIYPGNNVRFFPAGEEVPSRVEAGIGPSTPMGGDDVSEPQSSGAPVEVTGNLTYKPKSVQTVTTLAFVTTRELDESGRIEGSPHGAEMLSFPDMAYVRFKRKGDAKVGADYVVFHTAEQIFHPVTRKPVGYLTEFVGKVRVTALGDTYVKAQITETWDPIARGDLVGPHGNDRTAEEVVPRRNEKEVKGVVVTSLVPYQTLTAEHYFLVIDKGSADGVQRGNVFTITRRGDPARERVLNLELPSKKKVAMFPAENIALCLVTEVKDRASNCLLTRSLQEVSPGDEALMRVDPATAQR